jgi:hypothetical protein
MSLVFAIAQLWRHIYIITLVYVKKLGFWLENRIFYVQLEVLLIVLLVDFFQPSWNNLSILSFWLTSIFFICFVQCSQWYTLSDTVQEKMLPGAILKFEEAYLFVFRSLYLKPKKEKGPSIYVLIFVLVERNSKG